MTVEWIRRMAPAMLMVLVCALGVTACGGDDEDGGEAGGGGETVTLNVGVIPIADVAPLYVGIEQGFFEQENLRIEPKLAEGGAAIVPAVIAGDDQIGFSNATSLIIAASKNLPVQIISQGVLGGTGEDDAFDAMFVRKNSSIRDVEDLKGKTIAVNNLNNVGPLTINNALEKAGVDPKTVKYTEIPFPDATAALDRGRVDAVWVVEPFRSQALAAGHRMIMNPFEEAAPNFTVATYFATKEYIEENPDVVERFVRAMNRSLEFSQENPDAVRRVVPTYTQIPEEVAREMVLPTWKPDLNEQTLQLTIDLADRYGFVEAKPALDDLIHRAESG